MSKVKITWNENGFKGLQNQIKHNLTKEFSNKCYFCHKPVSVEEPLLDGTVPVCTECQKKQGS